MCFVELLNCTMVARQWPNRCGERNSHLQLFTISTLRTRQVYRVLSSSGMLTFSGPSARNMLPVSRWWNCACFLLAGYECIFPGHALVGFYFIMIETLISSGAVLINSFITQMHYCYVIKVRLPNHSETNAVSISMKMFYFSSLFHCWSVDALYRYHRKRCLKNITQETIHVNLCWSLPIHFVLK